MEPTRPIVSHWDLYRPCAITSIMRPELNDIRQAQQSLHEKAAWLKTCPDVNVPDAFHSVMHCAEHLFSLEQQLMEAYAFPSRQTHLEQHARVLRALHYVHGAVLRGESEQGRHAGGSLLLEWLSLHSDTIDAVLMIWVNYCHCGLIDPTNPHQSSTIKAH